MSSNKYYVHDEINSTFEAFETLEEARSYCKELIQELGDDGWPEELLDGGLKISKAIYESCKVNERPIPLNDDGDPVNSEWDFICDVEMVEIEN